MMKLNYAGLDRNFELRGLHADIQSYQAMKLYRALIVLLASLLAIGPQAVCAKTSDRLTSDHIRSNHLQSSYEAGSVTNRSPVDLGCEPGKPDRKSDLCAQWKAADAAVDSANWAERSFWAGVGTLIAAVAAACYARSAASYAGKSNEADDRPWIKVGYVAADVEHLLEGKSVTFEVDIVNTGRSKAYLEGEELGHANSCLCLYVGEGLPMRRPYSHLTQPLAFQTLTLRPGQSDTGKLEVCLTAQDREQLKMGAELYAMGFVSYKDHGIDRRTMFCRRYCPDKRRFFASGDPDYEVQH